MSRLRALLLPLVACVLLTPANAQSPATLQLGTPVERTLGPGQVHEFTVTLEENQFVQFVVEQRGIDVIVRVSTPAGKSIGEFDSPNGTDGPEHVSFVGVAAGSYRITVSPLNPNDATTTTGQYEIKLLERRQANEQEIKASRNQEVVKAKGIALLTEIEGIIPQIKSPLTRIRTQIHLAQLLWDSDEKRAARYISDATTGVKEFLASVDGGSPQYSQQYHGISQLRFEILNVLSERDPDAALSFLYSTVPPPNPYSQRREQGAQESMLELSIANRIARKDAQRAFQIAKQVLKTRLSSNLMTTVSQLRRVNPELATELANEIANKLLNEKLLTNHEAANLTMGLLRGRASGRMQLPEQSPNGPRLTLLSETQYRELIQRAYNDAFSYRPSAAYPERDAAWGLLNGLQQMGPELDNFISGGAAAVQKKLKEISDQQVPGGYDVQNALANSPVDAALELIAKAPQEQQEQLYVQLAGREAGNGDIPRARQIINDRVSNLHQRRQALINMDQAEMHRAISKGKVEEALRIIGNYKTPRERAAHVTQIATQIGPGQKRANAINLLEQAKSLLGSSLQAQDQDQMTALMEIARAFGKYDPKRSFEILDPLVDQLNELCAAARMLEGFGQEFYQDEELDLQNGNSVGQVASRVGNVLGTLALVNFERSKSSSDRLRLPEVRLRAYLEIAQQTIQPNQR